MIEARCQLSDGIDPSEQVKLDKIRASIAQANTFKAISWASLPSWPALECRNPARSRRVLHFVAALLGCVPP
jgi:hypothetical protein